MDSKLRSEYCMARRWCDLGVQNSIIIDLYWFDYTLILSMLCSL